MSNSPEVNRRYYEKNKQLVVERNRIVRERNRKVINDMRELTPCKDCGVNYPYYVMDFDHVDGEKKNDVTTLALQLLCSLKTLQEEIDKCEIVCSNCHRTRTYARRMGV